MEDERETLADDEIGTVPGVVDPSGETEPDTDDMDTDTDDSDADADLDDPS